MPETIVRTTIDIPADVLQAYATRALEENVTVEDYMGRHLARTVTHSEPNGLWLDLASRRIITKALGKRPLTGAELAAQIVRLVKVSVAGTEVAVQQPVLDRLKTRCFGIKLPEYIAQITVRALESEVGLR